VSEGGVHVVSLHGAVAPATAVAAGIGGPGVEALGSEDMSGALGVGVGAVGVALDRAQSWIKVRSVLLEARGGRGAARLAEMVRVDLPETPAANAVVDSGAVRRLVVRNAKHVIVVLGGEVAGRE
jgi:hypothetical protein